VMGEPIVQRDGGGMLQEASPVLGHDQRLRSDMEHRRGESASAAPILCFRRMVASPARRV
jgi:hypothetical protein